MGRDGTRCVAASFGNDLVFDIIIFYFSSSLLDQYIIISLKELWIGCLKTNNLKMDSNREPTETKQNTCVIFVLLLYLPNVSMVTL